MFPFDISENITIIIDSDYLKTMPLYSNQCDLTEYNDAEIMFAVIIKKILMVAIAVGYLDFNKFL